MVQREAAAAVALIRAETERLIAKCRAMVDAEEQARALLAPFCLLCLTRPLHALLQPVPLACWRRASSVLKRPVPEGCDHAALQSTFLC